MRRPPPARFPPVRLPSRRTVITAVLAALAASIVFRVTADAAATAESLGERVDVWVASAAVPAGETLGRSDVEAQAWPVAFVPDDAVTDSPVGRTVRAEVTEGEVIVAIRLGGDGASGPTALIPDGWRAVAIPTFDATPPVAPGQLVDIVITFDDTFGAPPGVLVADAVVVDVSDRGVVSVAVPARAAPEVATATALSAVTLTVVG